jgi:hypothetical protein
MSVAGISHTDIYPANVPCRKAAGYVGLHHQASTSKNVTRASFAWSLFVPLFADPNMLVIMIESYLTI